MNRRTKIALCVVFGLSLAGFLTCTVLFASYPRLTMVIAAFSVACLLAGTVILTERPRPGQPLSFTMVSRWRQFAVGMGFTLSPILAVICIVMGISWFPWGLLMLVPAVGCVFVTWKTSKKLGEYFPR
jgi:hypothetical protein